MFKLSIKFFTALALFLSPPTQAQNNTTMQSHMIAAGNYVNSQGFIFPLLAHSKGQYWEYPITSAVVPSDYHGTSISLNAFPGFYSASCSGLNCIVGGQYNNGSQHNPSLYPFLANSNDGGETWAYKIHSDRDTLPSNFDHSGIIKNTYCDGSNCFALGLYYGQSDYNSSFMPLLVQSNDGFQHLNYKYLITQAQHPFLYHNRASFDSMSCSGNICVAVGVYDAYIEPLQVVLTYPLAANSTDKGATWTYRIDGTATSIPKKGSNEFPKVTLLPADFVNSGLFKSVSCDGLNCIAAGQYSTEYYHYGKIFPLLAYSKDGGKTWTYSISSNRSTLPLDYNALKTAESDFEVLNNSYCKGLNCLVVGQYSNGQVTYPLLAQSQNGGVTWTYKIHSNHATLPFDYVNQGRLYSVYCEGINCYAAGQYSNGKNVFPLLVQSRDGGNSWTYKIHSNPTTLPPDFYSGGSFNSIRCENAHCVAAGHYQNGSLKLFPLLANSLDGGVSWAYGIDSTRLPYDFLKNGYFR